MARYRVANAHPVLFADYEIFLLGDELISGSRASRGLGRYTNTLVYCPSPEWRDGWERDRLRLGASRRLWDSLGVLDDFSSESHVEMIMNNGTMRTADGHAIFHLRTTQLVWPPQIVSFDAERGIHCPSGRVTWSRYSLGSSMTFIRFRSYAEGKREPRSSRNHDIREFGSQAELNAAIRQWIVSNPDLLVAAPELRHLVGAPVSVR